MVLLLHVLFSRLLLPLFSPPFPSTSSLLSPILLPLFFSFVSFHSVPPACREQPPEGTELWDPQAGGQPAEEPLGAHLAAGRLGGSVQVHATTRRGHGRAWGTAEPTRARPKRACRPCQAAAPLLRPGPRTPGSWPGCDTLAQGWPRVMPGAPLPARGRGWRCFPGLPLGLAGQLEMGTAPALLRVCPGHGLTPSGDFPLPPSLEWSGGFEPGFSSLSLGSPQPRLPASVPSLRRQPPARRLLPLPRAGRLQPARSGGGTCTRGPERPPSRACAASSVSAAVPAAAAHSRCSVTDLHGCWVLGFRSAPVMRARAGRGDSSACPAPPASPPCPCGCSPLLLCRPPSHLRPRPALRGGAGGSRVPGLVSGGLSLEGAPLAGHRGCRAAAL